MPDFVFPPQHSTNLQSLEQDGILVPVTLSAPLPLRQYLRKHGYPSYPTISGLGLVDTGASLSAVDDRVMLELEIPPVNDMETQTPHGLSFSHVYNASANLLEIGLPEIALEGCLGSYLGDPMDDGARVIMLIGRDILRHCVLTYNGPRGRATLSAAL